MFAQSPIIEIGRMFANLLITLIVVIFGCKEYNNNQFATFLINPLLTSWYFNYSIVVFIQLW
jgi:hypothetical protein